MNSNCCGATIPNYPDNDLCGDCDEHCEPADDNCAECGTELNSKTGNDELLCDSCARALGD